MKQKLTATLIGALLLTVSGYTYSDAGLNYAKVTSVEPITRTVRVNNPREECWSERVAVPERSGGQSYTAEIFGGILGAAIGNEFGSGRGKDAATAAGALLGGSIGRDIKNKRDSRGYYNGSSYELVERCETVDNYHSEERVDGYNVTYNYNGQEYRTRMRQDPGERIKVRVSVNPVY
ncbi:MAG: glycine zipper 2TM domain-containing protein [Arenicellales bacterium WSBS_2016_MAG_OTU3]